MALPPPPIAPEVSRNDAEEAHCGAGQGGGARPHVGRGLPSAPAEERSVCHQGRPAAHPCCGSMSAPTSRQQEPTEHTVFCQVLGDPGKEPQPQRCLLQPQKRRSRTRAPQACAQPPLRKGRVNPFSEAKAPSAPGNHVPGSRPTPPLHDQKVNQVKNPPKETLRWH